MRHGPRLRNCEKAEDLVERSHDQRSNGEVDRGRQIEKNDDSQQHGCAGTTRHLLPTLALAADGHNRGRPPQPPVLDRRQQRHGQKKQAAQRHCLRDQRRILADQIVDPGGKDKDSDWRSDDLLDFKRLETAAVGGKQAGKDGRRKQRVCNAQGRLECAGAAHARRLLERGIDLANGRHQDDDEERHRRHGQMHPHYSGERLDGKQRNRQEGNVRQGRVDQAVSGMKQKRPGDCHWHRRQKEREPDGAFDEAPAGYGTTDQSPAYEQPDRKRRNDPEGEHERRAHGTQGRGRRKRAEPAIPAKSVCLAEAGHVETGPHEISGRRQGKQCCGIDKGMVRNARDPWPH